MNFCRLFEAYVHEAEDQGDGVRLVFGPADFAYSSQASPQRERQGHWSPPSKTTTSPSVALKSMAAAFRTQTTENLDERIEAFLRSSLHSVALGCHGTLTKRGRPVSREEGVQQKESVGNATATATYASSDRASSSAEESSSDSFSDSSKSSNNNDNEWTSPSRGKRNGGSTHSMEGSLYGVSNSSVRRATSSFVDKLYALELIEAAGEGSKPRFGHRGGESEEAMRMSSLALPVDAIVVDAAGEEELDRGSRDNKNGGCSSAASVDWIPSAAIRPFLNRVCGLVTPSSGDLARTGSTICVDTNGGYGSRKERGASNVYIVVAAVLTKLVGAMLLSGVGTSSPNNLWQTAAVLPPLKAGDSEMRAARRTTVLLKGLPFVVLCRDDDTAIHMAMVLNRVLAELGPAWASMWPPSVNEPAGDAEEKRQNMSRTEGTSDFYKGRHKDTTTVRCGVFSFIFVIDGIPPTPRMAALLADVLRTGAAPSVGAQREAATHETAEGGSTDAHRALNSSRYTSSNRSGQRDRGLDHLSIIISEADTLLATDASAKSSVSSFAQRDLAHAISTAASATAHSALLSLKRAMPMVSDFLVSASTTSNKRSSSPSLRSLSLTKYIRLGPRAALELLRDDSGGDFSSNFTSTTGDFGFYSAHQSTTAPRQSFVAFSPTFIDVSLFLQSLELMAEVNTMENSKQLPQQKASNIIQSGSGTTRNRSKAYDVLRFISEVIVGRLCAVSRHYTRIMMRSYETVVKDESKRRHILGAHMHVAPILATDMSTDDDDTLDFENNKFPFASMPSNIESRATFIDNVFAVMDASREGTMLENFSSIGGGEDTSALLPLAALTRRNAAVSALVDSDAYVRRCLSVFLALCRGCSSSRNSEAYQLGKEASFSLTSAMHVLAASGQHNKVKGGEYASSGGDCCCPPLTLLTASGVGADAVETLYQLVFDPIVRDGQRQSVKWYERMTSGSPPLPFPYGAMLASSTHPSSIGASPSLQSFLNVQLSQKHLTAMRATVKELVRPLERRLLNVNRADEGGERDVFTETEQTTASQGEGSLLDKLRAAQSTNSNTNNAKSSSRMPPHEGLSLEDFDAKVFVDYFNEGVIKPLLFHHSSAEKGLQSSPTRMRSDAPRTTSAVFTSFVQSSPLSPSSPMRTIHTGTGMRMVENIGPNQASLEEEAGANSIRSPRPSHQHTETVRKLSSKAQAADLYARREVLLDTVLHWFIPNLSIAIGRAEERQKEALVTREVEAEVLTKRVQQRDDALHAVRGIADELSRVAEMKKAQERTALEDLKHVLHNKLRAEIETKLVELEKRYAARRNFLVGIDFADANESTAVDLASAASTLEQWRSPLADAKQRANISSNNAQIMISGRSIFDSAAAAAAAAEGVGRSLFSMSGYAQSPLKENTSSSHRPSFVRFADSSPTTTAADLLSSSPKILASTSSGHGRIHAFTSGAAARINNSVGGRSASLSPDTGLLRKKLRQEQNREELQSQRGSTVAAGEVEKGRIGAEDEEEELRILNQSSVSGDVTLKLLKEFSTCCDHWLRELLMPALTQLIDVMWSSNGQGGGESIGRSSSSLSLSRHFLDASYASVHGEGEQGDLLKLTKRLHTVLADLPVSAVGGVDGGREQQKYSSSSPSSVSASRRGRFLDGASSHVDSSTAEKLVSPPLSSQIASARNDALRSSNASNPNLSATYDLHTRRRGFYSPNKTFKNKLHVSFSHGLDNALTKSSLFSPRAAQLISPSRRRYNNGGSSSPKNVALVDDALASSPTKRKKGGEGEVTTGKDNVEQDTSFVTVSSQRKAASKAARMHQFHNNSYATVLIQRLIRELEEAKSAANEARRLAAKCKASEAKAKNELAAAMVILKNNSESIATFPEGNGERGPTENNMGGAYFISPETSLSLDVANHKLSKETAANRDVSLALGNLQQEHAALKEYADATLRRAKDSEKSYRRYQRNAEAELAQLKEANERLQAENVRLHLEKAQTVDALGDERHKNQLLSHECQLLIVKESASGANNTQLEAFYREGKRIRRTSTTFSDPYPVGITAASQHHNSAHVRSSTSRIQYEQQHLNSSCAAVNTSMSLRSSAHNSRVPSPSRAVSASRSPVKVRHNEHKQPQHSFFDSQNLRAPRPLSRYASRSSSPAALTSFNASSSLSFSSRNSSPSYAVHTNTRAAGVPIPLSPPGMRSFATKQAYLSAMIERDVEEVIESMEVGKAYNDNRGGEGEGEKVRNRRDERGKEELAVANSQQSRHRRGQSRTVVEPPSPIRVDPSDVQYTTVHIPIVDQLRKPREVTSEHTTAPTAQHGQHHATGRYEKGVADLSNINNVSVATSRASRSSRVGTLLPKEQLSPLSRKRAEAEERATSAALELSHNEEGEDRRRTWHNAAAAATGQSTNLSFASMASSSMFPVREVGNKEIAEHNTAWRRSHSTNEDNSEFMNVSGPNPNSAAQRNPSREGNALIPESGGGHFDGQSETHSVVQQVTQRSTQRGRGSVSTDAFYHHYDEGSSAKLARDETMLTHPHSAAGTERKFSTSSAAARRSVNVPEASSSSAVASRPIVGPELSSNNDTTQKTLKQRQQVHLIDDPRGARRTR